jgi:AraC-like DNA-binding protein
MAELPEDLTDQPGESAPRPEELVREGLRCLQLSGSLFLRADLSLPWAYESPPAEQVVQMLNANGRRVIMFHVITAGQCRIDLRNGEGIDLSAGDIAIMPFSDQHCAGNPSTSEPIPLKELLPPPPWTTLPTVRLGGGGAQTTMVCGYLYSDDMPFNPVLATLPSLIRVRLAGGPLAHWVEASLAYALFAASKQRGECDPLMQRLPELLFIECLCDFAAQLGPGERGWLAGLRDPTVGRALACMHREPARPWSLQELAKRAAASRSVLDERFRQFLGQAPMSYLTAWRLQLASRHLRTTTATLAEVAGAVGYGSEASFSRAFKRQVGVSPSDWRNGAPP